MKFLGLIITIVLVAAGAWIALSPNSQTESNVSVEERANVPVDANTMMEQDEVMVEDKMDEDKMMEKDEEAIIEQEKVTGDTMKKEGEVMIEKDEAMMEDKMEKNLGVYQDYSASRVASAQGDIVLFFMASWCPSCRTLDKNISASVSDIPAGVTILKVDYDSHVDLRKQYGLTYQHTLVQIDAQGNLIQKWSGGNDLASVTNKL